jgi:transcriptional antiterminator NusG
VGDNVKVISGALETFLGVVDDVSIEKQKARVIVHMFGRQTPVELDFNQIEKI